jgi:hypothetical protein
VEIRRAGRFDRTSHRWDVRLAFPAANGVFEALVRNSVSLAATGASNHKSFVIELRDTHTIILNLALNSATDESEICPICPTLRLQGFRESFTFLKAFDWRERSETRSIEQELINQPKTMKLRRNSFMQSAIASFAILSLAGNAAAQEKKADPTGTWNWTFTAPNGNTFNQKMVLKLDGEKLTGTTTGRGGNEVPIEEAKLKGNEISFQVTRERDGDKVVTKYQGKLSGDTITGKIESNFGGQPRTGDWEAKREPAKAAVKANVTGSWKYSLTTPGGQTFEPTLKLKQDGDKVSGVLIFGQNEAPISDGKIKDGEVSFKVDRERDGQTFTTKYTGKVEGEAMKGKINSNWGGNDRTFDFEAKRTKE